MGKTQNRDLKTHFSNYLNLLTLTFPMVGQSFWAILNKGLNSWKPWHCSLYKARLWIIWKVWRLFLIFYRMNFVNGSVMWSFNAPFVKPLTSSFFFAWSSSRSDITWARFMIESVLHDPVPLEQCCRCCLFMEYRKIILKTLLLCSMIFNSSCSFLKRFDGY